MTKKFFAILLALVLTFAMTAVAFATVSDSDVITEIDKNWVEGNTASATWPAYDLQFTMSYEYAEIDSDSTTTKPTLTATYDKDTKKITIPSANAVTFTSAGIFVYSITETAPSTIQGAGTPDSGKVYVKYVSEYVNGDNGRTLAVSGPYLAKPSDAGSDYTKKGDFTNQYTVHDLTISKTITGNFSDTSDQFPVTVKIEADDGLQILSAITNDSNNPRTADIIVNDVKTEVTATFYVTNGDTFVLKNIPDGVKVTVTETVNDNRYTTEYTVTGVTGTQNGTEATITGLTTDATVAFTNTKTQNVDTGITMDSIPYIVLLALAVVGIAAVTMKKRYEA